MVNRKVSEQCDRAHLIINRLNLVDEAPVQVVPGPVRFEYLSKLLGDLARGDAAVQTTTVARRAIAVAREDRAHIIRVHHQRTIPRHTGAVLPAGVVEVGHSHQRLGVGRFPVAAVEVSHD